VLVDVTRGTTGNLTSHETIGSGGQRVPERPYEKQHAFPLYLEFLSERRAEIDKCAENKYSHRGKDVFCHRSNGMRLAEWGRVGIWAE
jgi:hypothetical protein